MSVFSLCETLAKNLNWKIIEKTPSHYVIVDPGAYHMEPHTVKEFYDELSAMCSHALYNTDIPVVDTDVYKPDIWNKIVYAAQYGARLYLNTALEWITSPQMLCDPLKLSHILKTLASIDGFSQSSSALAYQADNNGTCSALLMQATRHVCEYICENSIFPALNSKIAACSREYSRSYMQSLIEHHVHADDLAMLRSVVPEEILLFILGMRKNSFGEVVNIPLPFPASLTSTSACIIASYLEMVGVLPISYPLYSSTRSLRPSERSLFDHVAVNTVPRGVHFNTTPFVIGMLNSGIKILLFTLPTEKEGKIALEMPKEKKPMNLYGFTAKLTIVLNGENGHQEMATLSFSWDRDHPIKPTHIDPSIDKILITTTCERRYYLEVTEIPLPPKIERRMTC